MKRKRICVFFAVFAAVLCFAFTYFGKREYSIYIPDALGTVSEIKIYARNDDAMKEIREYIYMADKLFSASDADSEIGRLNRGEQVELSIQTEELLNLSLKYADPSDFNPFCGSLIELWEDARKNGVPPEQSEIVRACGQGYPFSLEISNHTARITNLNQKINLGAVAKGYISDGINDILDKYKVDSALIYLGGNVYAKGKNESNSAWRIGVCDPDTTSGYLGIVHVQDMAVVTSGDYERFFEYNQKRYHHIINPDTGYPAESGLRSVTVICENGTLGDMLSTKCFIDGLQKSKEVLANYGAYGIFVTDDGKVFYSRELGKNFERETDKYEFYEF